MGHPDVVCDIKSHRDSRESITASTYYVIIMYGLFMPLQGSFINYLVFTLLHLLLSTEKGICELHHNKSGVADILCWWSSRGNTARKGIIIFGSLWGISDFLHLDTLNSKQVCHNTMLKHWHWKKDLNCGGGSKVIYTASKQLFMTVVDNRFF